MPVQIQELANTIVDFKQVYNKKLATLFSPGGEEDCPLTKSQIMVLMSLCRKPEQTATELGVSLDMTKASLTGIFDQLEAKGLARRVMDSADRRKSHLVLSERGTETAEGLARRFDAALARRIAPLSEAEREDLRLHLSGAAAVLGKL